MSHAVKITLAAIVLAAPAAPAQGRQVAVSNPNCEVFRILADGRQVRTKAPEGVSARGSSSGRSSSISIRSRSGGSSSSASAFSSSSGGGRGTARAVSSYTDEEGRTVTTTQDEKGCRIVIDDR